MLLLEVNLYYSMEQNVSLLFKYNICIPYEIAVPLLVIYLIKTTSHVKRRNL